jgi:hypothetical protein
MKKNDDLIKTLKSDINSFFNVTIENGTKTNDEVYARLIYYNLYKIIDPNVTLMGLGETVNKDHSTVIYALKRFDQSYLYDKRFKYLYDSFMLHHPKYLQEVYLKEVYTNITDSLSDVIKFVCTLDVDKRVMFINQMEELKKSFIINNLNNEGVL